MKRIALSVVTVLALSLSLAWLKRDWVESRFKAWLQERLIRESIAKIQPKLPFKIEDVALDGSWSDITQGKISNLRLKLKWGSVKMTSEGPLDFDLHSTQGQISAHYDAKLLLRAPQGEVHSTLDLDLTLGKLSLELASLDAQLESEAVKLKDLAGGSSVEAEKVLLTLELEDSVFKGSLSNHSLLLSQGAHSIHLEGLGIDLESPLGLSPLALGPKSRAQIQAASTEVLWNDLYLSLNSRDWPIRADLYFDAQNALQKIDTQIGPNLKRSLSASWERGQDLIHWKTPSLDLKAILPPLKLLPEGLQILAGTLNSTGSAHRQPQGGWMFETHNEIRDAAAAWSDNALMVSGLNLSLPYSSAHGITAGKLSAKEILYKRFTSKLAETRFTLSSSNHLLIPGGPKLVVDGIPFRFGDIKGGLDGSKTELTTSLALDGVPLDQLLKRLCVDVHLPPTLVHGSFDPVELTPTSIDPTGELRAETLGGTLRVNDIGFFDLNTPVVEMDFNADWDMIRLDLLGEWLGFGEMDGVLTGFAHDVTIQGWLPTLFDFKAEVKPFHRSKVVFSPDAMKNFVRLFSGSDIDALPGFADWLAFGWPSRVFGGYDVRYAGIMLYSSGGSILLETLDPAKTLAAEGKHFILYGPRFRMPLQTSHYPVVLDAAGIANYGRHMLEQLMDIAKKKREKDHEIETSCLPAPLERLLEHSSADRLRDSERQLPGERGPKSH